MDDADLTEDGLLGGAVRLLQPRRGHRAGTDAVLLAGLAAVRDGDIVADLGSASGAVGLMVAHRVPTARLLFVDRDPDLAALCERNIGLNGFTDRAGTLTADLFAPDSLPSAAADLVVTNPPYLDDSRDRASPNPGRHAAHAMGDGGLAAWISAASRILKARGRLTMIHRADRLPECLDALRGRFGGLRLTFIYPRKGEAAGRVVIAGTLGSRAPLAVAPPLTLHRPGGAFTAAAERLHRG